MSVRLLMLAMVVGVVVSLTGIDLLLQMEGNPLLGVPYPPEFLDMYWTELPAAGITLIGAGSVLVIAPAVWLVARLRRGPYSDYKYGKLTRSQTKSYRIDENESGFNLGQEPSYAEKHTFISKDGERVFKKVPTDENDDEVKSEDFDFVSKKATHIATKHYEFEDGNKKYTDGSDETLFDAYDTKGNVLKKTVRTYVIEDGERKYVGGAEIAAVKKEKVRNGIQYNDLGREVTTRTEKYSLTEDDGLGDVYEPKDELRVSTKCTNCGTEVGVAVTNCPSCGMKLASTL